MSGLLLLLVLAADGPERWGFHPGTAPIDGVETLPSAESCGDCHPTELAAWTTSRHRVSWTNALFQREYQLSPSPFCVYCHAPLAGQAAEILEGAAGATRDQGVTCATCHLRRGLVLGPSGDGGGEHPTIADPGLRDPAFCASCHDFDTPGAVAPPEPMQATAREAAGERCVSCHMPGGDHHFGGGHDLEALRGALAVSVERRGRALVFTLAAQGTAHALPTGDLFRHLTLEVQDPGGRWTELAWLGRRLESMPDPSTGTWVRRTTLDTRLWPGRPLTVRAESQASSWRVRMHYAADDSPLPESERVTLVSEGSCPPGPQSPGIR